MSTTSAPPPAPPHEPQFYSPSGVAFLVDRSERWVYAQIRDGKIRIVRQYGRTTIPRSEVDRILAGRAETPAGGHG